MSPDSSPSSLLVISYLTLRKAVGAIGTALPFALALGLLALSGGPLPGSLSAYYHSRMGDVFVGALCAIGVFLLSYKGYERIDNIAGNLACLFAVGTALFPMARDESATRAAQWIGGLHFALAGLFFVTLAFFSLFLFTKTDPVKPPTPRKLQRNRVYRVCGYAILGAILVIGVYTVLPGSVKESVDGLRPVFWLESAAIVAFGISWLTKGEALLGDET